MTVPIDPTVFEHLAYSVFLPPKLPQEEQKESFQRSVDLAIIDSVVRACHEYPGKSDKIPQWNRIELMLRRLSRYVEAPLEKSRLSKDIKNLRPEDFLVLHIQAQNTGLIIRKQIDQTIFEAFEVQAQAGHVMSTAGKIVRHFPGPAVQIPNTIAADGDFIDEVANILAQMNTEVFDEAIPKTRKAGNEVQESRDSTNPNYFIQFFFGFLRGMGSTVDPPRVVKRIADEVLWKDALNPWRRSPIWLIIRVALQTSLDSAIMYKHFMAYYHASVLSQCSKHNTFSSDLLYAMRVKMARRLYKLKDTAPQFLIDTATAAAKDTQVLLQGRWDSIQSAQAQSPNQDFSGVDFKSATYQTLPNSRDYLERVFKGRSGDIKPSDFTPKHASRLENITEFSSYDNGALSKAFANDPDLALFDFEASVFENLAHWTSQQRGCAGACITLSSCFRQYLNAAQPYYTTDIADQSIMMLTLARIWMAVDELATKDSPLLSEYSPELPSNILDPLLFRTSQHIEQARLIQQHIRTRRSAASVLNPSIFSGNTTSACFGARFFKNSPRHKRIKSAIEKDAEEKRKKKIQELLEQNVRYKQLSREIDGMSHEYDYSDGWERHPKWCKLCSKQKERGNLQIKPYEWPLPSDQSSAEVVIFELEPPESFTVWRNLTYEILVDFGAESPRDECTQYTTLDDYDPLSPWLSSPAAPSRVTIASATKSFMQSHYGGTLTIPSTESQVCLNNALQFRLYDKNGEAWATAPFPDVTFAKFGTLKLSSESVYHYLQYALEGTTHTSNQVMADQYDCPNELTLHEHIAFGTLRSGGRIQWMNIARGLEEDLLTFSSEDVWLLHTQAAWQIGPLSSDGSREWHEVLDCTEFGLLLVSQCTRVLARVKANWLQAKSVLTIVTLISRLLATRPSEGVIRAGCSFLRAARVVAYGWLEELVSKLQGAVSEDDVIAYQQRVCEMAAVCHATYDIEPDQVNLLLGLPGDYTALIKASIRLHDNKPPDLRNATQSLRVILSRNRRFVQKIVPHILASVRLAEDVMTSPLSNIWPSSKDKVLKWRVLEVPSSRWLTTTTDTDNGNDETSQGHFNLFTGRLLVNGKPLGRLPRQYVEHATYIRLFGQKILDVVPAKSAGMDYMTPGLIHGYQISFALDNNSGGLVIQARTGSSLYELIPHQELSEDFPLFLSKDYFHWAHIKNKTVELRPMSSPWIVDSHEWVLSFDASCVLKNSSNSSCLVDIHSAAFKSVARSIQSLESDKYLHLTRSAGGLIGLELPRMKLSFFVNKEDQLESRNFREQVLDENQSAGTLLGLKN